MTDDQIALIGIFALCALLSIISESGIYLFLFLLGFLLFSLGKIGSFTKQRRFRSRRRD